MTAAEIRQAFIDFFVSKDHKHVPSAPVVPQDDPTLLFVNAGMNQFKDVFLGKGTRNYSRAVNSQKCIRVSGKHNDLEEVGPSPIHHTFFEMLGNWSFGDYYKAEAIQWAWELLTEVYKLDKSRLYATVYTEDDEAHKLWESGTGIDPSHISRHDKKDNFWEMGDVGPCGPCSEIHYDLGKPLPGHESPPDDGPNSDSGRFIELWNLVFIQYRRDPAGKLHDLPAKHVDTGAGLERIARVMQGVDSNYDTDLFRPVIQAISERTGVPYLNEKGDFSTPHRVIADHLRSLSFAIADGALPSNDGRGYVLRRILRRASRFCRELKYEEPLLHELVPVLVDTMGDHFSELKERAKHIEHVIRAEEESFGRTLDKGLKFFDDIIRKGGIIETVDRKSLGIQLKYNGKQLEFMDLTKGKKMIHGMFVFVLYERFGFPLDLIELMAREHNLEIDMAGYNEALNKHREKSRKAVKIVSENGQFTTISEGDHSEFVGYDKLTCRCAIRKIRFVEGAWKDANDPEKEEKPVIEVVLERTPFYAEAGGQVADQGVIRGSKTHLKVDDVRQEGDLCVHICRAVRLPEKENRLPGQVEAKVDADRRNSILPHHTTTHLLQAALRKVLGDHITQAGSHVTPDYMTFDYTHFEKPSKDELDEVEALVNRWIREDHPVSSEYTTVEEAKAAGAMALFGEKYGDIVRAVIIGEKKNRISLELCGGTHLSRTGEAGLFRIESDTALSAGVRRIETTAGEAAYKRTVAERGTLDRVYDLVGSRGSDPSEKLVKLINHQKELEKEVGRLKKAVLQGTVNFVEDWGGEVAFGDENVLLVSGVFEAATDRDGLQQAGDKIIEDLKKAKRQGIGLTGAPFEETFMFVVVVSEELVKRGVHAGKLVGAFAKKAGGGGGGKPGFATAGSREHERADALIRNRKEVNKFVAKFLEDILRDEQDIQDCFDGR